jgi:hypothetical protein
VKATLPGGFLVSGTRTSSVSTVTSMIAAA